MSKSIDKPVGTAIGTKEMLIFNPTTGQMERITLSSLSTFFGSGDVTAPTVVSCTCPNSAPDTLIMIFSENVTGVSIGDFTFKKNGSAWSDSSVSGSGTTWTFTMATPAVFGDTLLRTYTGISVIDGSSNQLATFTDVAVTNNVASGTPATHTSNFTAANGTGITAYTPDSGSAWENTYGTWEIQSNKAVSLTLPGGNNAWSLTPLTAADKTITAVMSGITSSYFGQILVRATDTSNYLIVHISDTAINVYQSVSGTPTTLRTESVSTDSAEHTWVVTVVGTNIALKKDGVDVWTTQAFSSSVTYAKFGIGQAGGATPGQILFNSITAA